MSSDFIVGFKYKIIQVYCQKYTKNGEFAGLSVVSSIKQIGYFYNLYIECRQDFRESNSTALLRTTHEKKKF